MGINDGALVGGNDGVPVGLKVGIRVGLAVDGFAVIGIAVGRLVCPVVDKLRRITSRRCQKYKNFKFFSERTIPKMNPHSLSLQTNRIGVSILGLALGKLCPSQKLIKC